MQYSLFDATAQKSWPQGAFLVMDAGNLRPAQPQEILKKAAEIAAEPTVQREMCTSPKSVGALFATRLHSSLEHEVFAMVLLDAQHQLIEYLEPFRGTLTQASVYPREVVKMALSANAAAVIIAHNHPSGELVPSSPDLQLTKHLAKALALVDIKLLDHILVADGKTYSFAAAGQM